MSIKRRKKNTTKNKKKVSKNRKIPALRLGNDVEIPARTTYIKDTECFRIDDIDTNKIRVSDKKLYNKEHNSLSDCNWTRTHNRLVHKGTLNYLAKLAK